MGKVPSFQASSSSLAGATTLPSQAPQQAGQQRDGKGARRPSLSLNLPGGMDGVENTSTNATDSVDASSSTPASGSSSSTVSGGYALPSGATAPAPGTGASAGYTFNVHPFSYNHGGHGHGHSNHGAGSVTPMSPMSPISPMSPLPAMNTIGMNNITSGMNGVNVSGMNGINGVGVGINGINSTMGSVTPLSPMSPMSPMSSFPSALAAALVDRSNGTSTLTTYRPMGGGGETQPQPGTGYVTPAMLFSNAGTPEPEDEDGDLDAEGDVDEGGVGGEDGEGGDDGVKGRGKDEKREKDRKKKGGKGNKGPVGVKDGAAADGNASTSSTLGAASATSSLKKNRSPNPVGRPPNPNIKSHIKGGLSGLSGVGTGGLGGTGGVGGLLLGASKPFKCPKPNCNKSYKQANGLKYHITHGSCSFAPPKDLEHVQALLERKRKDRAAALSAQSNSASGSTFGVADDGQGQESVPGSGWNSPAQMPSSPSVGPSAGGYGFPSGTASTSTTAPSSPTQAHMNAGSLSSLSGLSNQSNSGIGGQASGLVGDVGDLEFSESELLALSLEAEKKLKPFACGVGDCPRRYKNMNGLRYHYAHSGEHGTIGLAMLASGVHECLQNNHSKSHHHKDREFPSSFAKEREGRKAIRGLGSKPASRANSRSRTGTPLPSATGVEGVAPTSQAASFAAQQIQQLHQAQSAVPSASSNTTPTATPTNIPNPNSSSTGATSTPSNPNPTSHHPTPTSTPSLTPTPAQIQAQAHLVSAYPAYQQRFLEHQRAQYAAQMQQQHQHQQQAPGQGQF